MYSPLTQLQLLDVFFTQSLDGFFFMMLEDPLQWDDTTDKEAALDYAFAHQRVTQVNDAMLTQYGATREQFLGRTPGDFFSHNIDYGRQVWRQFFDNGHWHVETEERKLDGAPMYAVSGCLQGQSVVVEIRDTGCGISESALPNIFTRFWRQDEAHSTPGFGLGLPIAQQIIAGHGGKIEVESQPGIGSAFRVFLPVRQ
jgi:light-regulated signal transduction histidine kinase (bacteriophytochrome)